MAGSHGDNEARALNSVPTEHKLADCLDENCHHDEHRVKKQAATCPLDNPRVALAEHGQERDKKKMLPPLLLKSRQPTTSMSHQGDTHNDCRIRCRYLHSLGMDDELHHHDHPTPKFMLQGVSNHSDHCSHGDDNTSGHQGVVDHHLMLEALPFRTVPLNADGGAVDQQLAVEGRDRTEKVYPIKKEQAEEKEMTPVSSNNEFKSVATKQVSYDTVVKVRTIPSHRQYSERMKSTMWILPTEAAESIYRNAIEFLAEACEPERVLDESDFVERDGKLVHPVCLLLDQPENRHMRRVYYGIKPDAQKRKISLEKRRKQQLAQSRMHTI